MLLGCFLRIYDLGGRPLWYDELYSIKLAKMSVSANIENLENNQPPLYQIILHFWIKFFNSDKIAVRSLSLMFGVASIWLIYEVSRLLFDQKAALLSSFLLAVSNFHIHYSQETRDYALFAMLTLASFLFFIKLLQSPKPRFFIGYFAATSLLYYAHNYALFVIISQNLYFMLRWERCREFKFKWFFAQIGALALFAPWIPSLLRQVHKKYFIIPSPSFNDLPEMLNTYIDFGKRNLVILFFVILFFAVLLMIRKEKDNAGLGNLDKTALLALWLVCPILISLIVSKFFMPIYMLRYTICASVAFYIIIGRAISNLR